jgi:hypothetical protein
MKQTLTLGIKKSFEANNSDVCGFVKKKFVKNAGLVK